MKSVEYWQQMWDSRGNKNFEMVLKISENCDNNWNDSKFEEKQSENNEDLAEGYGDWHRDSQNHNLC